MTFDEWWWEFISVHPEWRYSDSDALRKAAFKAGSASRDAEVAELKAKLEIEQMRNVACGVVAMADTPDSAKQARNMHPDYMSAACSDVARRVDECIQLRKDVEMLRKALDYVIRDLKLRADMKEDDEHGIVDIGNGALIQAEEALAATEPKP